MNEQRDEQKQYMALFTSSQQLGHKKCDADGDRGTNRCNSDCSTGNCSCTSYRQANKFVLSEVFETTA